jgi:type IV pilus assembly protein PilA
MRAIKEDREDGFTLIELLVVMIIIGILAAIAIPVFLSQRQKGYDASVKSDLRVTASELESYNTDYQAYPLATGFGSITSGAMTVAPGDTVRVSNGNSFAMEQDTAGTAYCIIGVNVKGTRPWMYVSSQGGLQTTTLLASGQSLPTIATTCPAVGAF